MVHNAAGSIQMRRFDPTPLQHFIANKDRDKPILFAGRATEIAAVDDAIKAVKRGSVAGQTLLFTGAPGAGKTALLRHLQLHLTDCRSASFPAHALSDPRQVVIDIISQIDPKTGETLNRSTTTAFHGEAGASPLKVGGAYSKTELGPTLSSLRALAQSIRPDILKSPIVLFMDEAQNAEADLANTQRSSLLQDLHEGQSGPFLLIAGGLSQSLGRFSELGISRFATNSVLALGCLTPHDVREVVERFFVTSDFGIQVGSSHLQESWLAAIMDESKGWPQHLTNTLISAAEEIIRANGILEHANLESALAESRRRREDYYAQRQGDIPIELIAEVFSIMPNSGGATFNQIDDAIDTAYRRFPKTAKKLSQDAAYITLLNRGLLQECRARHFDAPIPSMRDFIDREARKEGWRPA